MQRFTVVRIIILFLFLVAVLEITALGASEYDGPPISNDTANQIAVDLALSESQEKLWVGYVSEYQQRLNASNDEVVAERKQWLKKYWIDFMPELDESSDISHLSDMQQLQILNMRLSMQNGSDPNIQRSFEDIERRNEYLTNAGQSLYKRELAIRKDTLQRLKLMLADTQLERWPQAMRHLTINMEDQNPGGITTVDDPRWKVDLLLLLRQSTEDGAELSGVAEAIRFPEVVLNHENADERMTAIAQRILDFEMNYASVLDDYSGKKMRLNYEWLPLYNRGDTEAAEKLALKEADLKRRIWDVRMRFVEDIGLLVLESLGEESRLGWDRRWRKQFFPMLYLEESTDILYGYIKEIEGLDKDVLLAMEEIFAQHEIWRESLKVRMVKLEIKDNLLRKTRK